LGKNNVEALVLRVEGLQVIGKTGFYLRKDVLYSDDPLDHTIPVYLEAVAVKGYVPEATVRRKGGCQSLIEQCGETRMGRRAETLEEIHVPRLAGG
jgi:hypothetical protein